MKKAAKATRTTKRGKLPPRAEWDFSKVTRKDSAVVCMREYAKQCLREVSEKRAHNYVLHLAQQYDGKLPGVTKKGLLEAVHEGLKRRSTAETLGARKYPALFSLPSDDWDEMPPTAQISIFAINWSATNNEIKKAFGQWLNKQSKRRHNEWEWMGGIGGVLLEPLGLSRNRGIYDYVAAAKVIRETFTSNALSDITPDDVGPIDGATLIKLQRGLLDRKKGRGDGKRAQLTDLAVFRLNRAGCDAAQIAAALGRSRLKFYDDALVQRARKGALGYLALTLSEAFFCEAHAIAIEGEGTAALEAKKT